jgi:hypothetical protein
MSPYAPLRSLGETQLQIQFTLLATYDARAIGVLAIDSALAALSIAASGSIGRFWWLSLVGLLLAGLPCVVALGRASELMALKIARLLPVAGGYADQGMEEALVRSIARAIAGNEADLRAKRALTLAGVALTGGTICTAIISLIVS